MVGKDESNDDASLPFAASTINDRQLASRPSSQGPGSSVIILWACVSLPHWMQEVCSLDISRVNLSSSQLKKLYKSYRHTAACDIPFHYETNNQHRLYFRISGHTPRTSRIVLTVSTAREIIMTCCETMMTLPMGDKAISSRDSRLSAPRAENNGQIARFGLMKLSRDMFISPGTSATVRDKFSPQRTILSAEMRHSPNLTSESRSVGTRMVLPGLSADQYIRRQFVATARSLPGVLRKLLSVKLCLDISW